MPSILLVCAPNDEIKDDVNILLLDCITSFYKTSVNVLVKIATKLVNSLFVDIRVINKCPFNG